MVQKTLLGLAFFITAFSCINFQKQETFKVVFDSSKEVSGKKFALNEISPELDTNWDGYNYLIMEFRISTAQRFQVGLTTDSGYNELRIMSYVPNAWNKLAIPLRFFRQLPDANIDLAATFNQPRYTGWINLGGDRGPLHGVDSIGFRMRAPIGNPEIEIRSITLSVEDPGDAYLEQVPAIDEFGQYNLKDYEGKIHSLDELRNEWTAEDNEAVSTGMFNYGKFGGYRQKQVKATGFFRTELIDGRWWFVDPEGYLFLSVGVDCISPGRSGNAKDVDKRRNMFSELPPEQFRSQQPGRENDYHFGQWNLYRRYGNDYKARSIEMVIKRMEKWGINTIANWSGAEVIALNKKAFIVTMRTSVIDRGLMGLADVYAADFRKNLEAAIGNSVSAYRDNPWLIGYFVANEPSWLGEESRLCDIILKGEERPIKVELQKFLSTGDTKDKRKEFVFNTFRIFLASVNETQKKYDPNHLNLGIRFGNIQDMDSNLLKICSESFDVLSFNCYDLAPKQEMMDRALAITGLPMIIGEYHFGTIDRFLAQSLWQVDSQEERGIAYRYYTEQGYSHPGLIGTAYFQWCDQDITGRRNDGENYNCGLIDVTDRPYKYQVEAMTETAKHLYEVHSGLIKPYSQTPARARGHERIPDVWNK